MELGILTVKNVHHHIQLRFALYMRNTFPPRIELSLFHTTQGLSAIEGLEYPEISIEKGRFTFIAGESGCGKSTYLKLLNGILLPVSGNIEYNGTDIRSFDPLEYRRKVLLVPQEPFLTDGTILDSFSFYYGARGQEMPSEEDLSAYMEMCCLKMPLDTPAPRLSGGERQRAFLSIFLSFSPEVLLLDEPTAALDEKTSERLLESIRSHCVSRKMDTVCVCHNEDLINEFSEDTVRLG